MQKFSKWTVCAGLSTVVLMGLAGCNKGEDSGTDNGVSPGIQSPVMSKQDDKAMAGTDGGTGNSTSTDGSASNSTASNGGTTGAGGKMNGAGGTGGKSAVPAPNTKKQ